MQPVKISENIYWVGGIDWNLRNFHGYLTQRGSTYNAFLIIDEKITLIDTVKGYLGDEMISRISKIVDPSKIDYIVSNHVEMDHSGALPQIMELAPDATIITCNNGKKGLEAHYKGDWNFRTVKSGDVLEMGKNTLQFILTPMVHWPDNMFCYMPETEILFSNDGFGQHLASSERFEDQFETSVVMDEAKKYYANILLSYGKQTKKALKSVADLSIKMIAPSHGVLWRRDIDKILEAYQKWSGGEAKERAVIVYDSMWGSTEKMAHAVQSAFDQKGISSVFYDLKVNHISDIITEVLEAKYVCVGSPTLNGNLMPNVASFLTYMRGLAPEKRIGLAFGSFGWSGQSVKQVETYLQECKMELLNSFELKYVPDTENLEEITNNLIEQLNNLEQE